MNARIAISPSGRTTSARTAGRTGAARSNRSAAKLRNALTARVAVDALGSDKGPEEIVAGALDAASDRIVPIVFGWAGLGRGGLELVETTQAIGMDEKPADAFRTKQESSLVRACKAVADGQADAVVSAGNTGAMVAASLVLLRRLPGVRRPGIAVPIPARQGPSVLIDSGANADARPEHLVQFAHMGSIFAQEVLEIPRPVVRLLSIGEEPEKGNQLTLEAHARLDSDTYGGAYLLGLGGLVVIAHGRSSSRAITNAIELAARGVEHRVVERLAERLAKPDRVVAV